MRITVDYSKLNETAEKVESFVAEMKRNMSSADSKMVPLFSAWNGKDSAQFKAKWDNVANPDSVYSITLKQLESYASYLRYAASRYAEAQKDAIARAYKLPKS